jgi:hypothetical protein
MGSSDHPYYVYYMFELLELVELLLHSGPYIGCSMIPGIVLVMVHYRSWLECPATSSHSAASTASPYALKTLVADMCSPLKYSISTVPRGVNIYSCVVSSLVINEKTVQVAKVENNTVGWLDRSSSVGI